MSPSKKRKKRKKKMATEQTLARLVSYPTVSDRPLTALAAYLAERSEALGMTVEVFETSPGKHNVVARAGPEGTDGLALCGHMDVVPVEGQAWSSDPFTLTARDGALYGRGACDMKGFIAAAVEAVGRLPLDRLRRELLFIWTHDEEVGGMGSAALAGQLAGRRLPTATWIGEPTGFRVCRFHPGHLAVRIRCTGRAAHSSRPELGLNAIQLAAHAIVALEALADALTHERVDLPGLERPWTVMNTGCIHGGAAINIVPEHCDVLVGLRPPPGADSARLLVRIQQTLAPLAARARDQGGDIVASHEHELPALLTPADTVLEHLLRPHADRPETVGMPFGTDAGNLTALGAAPLIFGPGSIDVAHRPDEHISIPELHRATDLIAQVARARCLDP
ncbi:MAG: acetylornithine deacetylase [Myxococcota bacterium]|jgi:acetylornithine deacetylase